MYSTIGGGSANLANGLRTTISGGVGNEILADDGTIGGGFTDSIGNSAFAATIAGGQYNAVFDAGGSIGGGSSNKTHRMHSTIAGGLANESVGDFSTIAGGWSNKIDDNDRTGNIPMLPKSPRNSSFIGGGQFNVVAADFAVVVGGHEVHAVGTNSFVGGGGSRDHISPEYSNQAKGEYSVVVGGSSNEANGKYSFIGGGGFDPDGGHTIPRQEGNIVQTQYGVIVGGRDNLVRGPSPTVLNPAGDTTKGHYGSILGGHNLITQSHGQTALGYWNKTQGSLNAATNASNDRLLIIGNGTEEDDLRSNAFEVSANGHSIVYDELSAPDAGGAEQANPATAPVYGATYVDNIIYAWGEVPLPIPGAPTVLATSSFGINPTINLSGTNGYTITLNLVDPQTGLGLNLTEGSVTATIQHGYGVEAPGCKTLSVSNISGNQFSVYTYNLSSGCSEARARFTFKVTGRVR